MNVKKVGNVILAVEDLDKSVDFYHNLIGLPVRSQRRSWVDLGTSGALLSLHPASLDSDGARGGGIMVGFLVGDIVSALDELRSKGVRVHKDITDRSAGKHAIVADPDGYLVSLFEPKFEDETQQTGGYHGFTPA